LKIHFDHRQSWDIIADPQNNIWDLSLYNGKLYAYFGAVPALIFFVPYRIITGTALNDG